jgi:hypothetical protein
LASIKIDLRTSVIKPRHAAWLVGAWEAVAKKRDLIQSAFGRAGIDSEWCE